MLLVADEWHVYRKPEPQVAIKNLAVKLSITSQIIPPTTTLPLLQRQRIPSRRPLHTGSLRCAQFKGKSLVKVFQDNKRHGIDQKICAALFSPLRTQAATPPTVYNEPPTDTPFKSTSSSQRGSEQTHDALG
ncbi:hypothetical protein EJ08DRAFT_703550 [Tothia fuscella]|uniref:Uncharacterized protein n=1 Tax=Tothia fuscella TaxID=1048955 RepID=A0A9P4NEH5_9PEZI|nr:hypothetical protein EJ08DRAFT_703550 [Tothia fuscella]